MPHRIVICCTPCSRAAHREIEITEVTIWIDEDCCIYFIANCDCGNSQTVKTSAQALQKEYFRLEGPIAREPRHVM